MIRSGYKVITNEEEYFFYVVDYNVDTIIKMDDYLKYCMALKIGNYYAALLHLRAIEQQWVDAYNEMNERGYMTKEYEEKTKRGLEKFRKEIEMVANQDEQAIRDFIHNNEAYSISNLKGVYKK
jgi:hypothetical protein